MEKLKLKLTSINKNYHSQNVIKDFNYEFVNGKLYVLQGKSGSGKTTLLSIIARHIKSSSGTIVLNGKAYSKKDISFFSQQSKLYMDMNVEDNLLLVSSDREAIKEVLKIVGLEGKEKDYGSILSKGEASRLAIARAMLQKDKKIFIFDEPCGNLDKKNSNKMLDIFRYLSKNHIVIISSHDSRFEFLKDDVCFYFKDGTITVKDDFDKENTTSYNLNSINSSRFKDNVLLLLKQWKTLFKYTWKTYFVFVIGLSFISLLTLLDLEFLSSSVSSEELEYLPYSTSQFWENKKSVNLLANYIFIGCIVSFVISTLFFTASSVWKYNHEIQIEGNVKGDHKLSTISVISFSFISEVISFVISVCVLLINQNKFNEDLSNFFEILVKPEVLNNNYLGLYLVMIILFMIITIIIFSYVQIKLSSYKYHHRKE